MVGPTCQRGQERRDGWSRRGHGVSTIDFRSITGNHKDFMSITERKCQFVCQNRLSDLLVMELVME